MGNISASILGLAITVLMIVSLWKVFEKSGQLGWACIIPIYNLWVLCEIADKPGWWIIVMILFAPIGIFMQLFVCIGVAESFNRGAGFGFGLWLLPFIFYPILAFTD